jgi:adenosylhomocysteinase
MKNDVLLANAGHFDVEISIPELEELASRKFVSRPGIWTYELPDGRSIHLMAEGRLVNLASGDGHPIEIMDLSFALQLLSALYIFQHDLEPGVHKVPDEIDLEVSRLKLETLGIKLEAMTPEQESYMREWRE